MRPFSVFAAAAVFLAFCGPVCCLKASAVNIKVFGVKKLDNEAVMTTLVKIVRRYDLVFIQEVRDRTGEVLPAFLDAVNSGSEYEYDMVVSPRLGTTKSKEQYAYIYRITTVAILHDPFVSEQDFERPPYCVQVKPADRELPTFVAIGVHVKPKPEVTKAEIDRLPAVYEEAVAHFHHLDLQTHDEVDHAELAHEALQNEQYQAADLAIAAHPDEPDLINLGDELLDDLDQNQNPVNVPALLMGDFNADGRYLSKDEYKNLKLRTDGRFKSLIDEKTNVKNTSSYDRFFAAGGLEKYLKNKPTVFHFDKAYNLSPAQTEAVSDHYPIELELQPLPTENTETSTSEGGEGAGGGEGGGGEGGAVGAAVAVGVAVAAVGVAAARREGGGGGEGGVVREEERKKEERKKEKERKKEERKKEERKNEEKEKDDEERRRKEESWKSSFKIRSSVKRQ